MNINEQMLRRENDRLITENELLRRKLQIAENINFQRFRENQELSEYIRNMEGGVEDETLWRYYKNKRI